MMYILDRIEDDVAVLEDDGRKTHDFPIAALPADVRVGDCLYLLESGEFVIDKDQTEARRARIIALQEMLFKK